MEKWLFILIFFMFSLITTSTKAQKSTKVDSKETDKAHHVRPENEMKWVDDPLGVKVAILQGNPYEKGLYTVRVIVPANWSVAPHWHPEMEVITVLDGNMYVGTGKKYDESTAVLIERGGISAMPGKIVHYAFTKEECTFQVHGMGPVERFFNEEDFKQVNGLELHYRTIGKGEPLVLLPGGPGLDASYLHPGLDQLSEKFRLISFDPRGTGKSKGGIDTSLLTIDQLIEDLEGFRQAMGIERMHLIGHSYGGLLAMLYASKYPNNLYSMTLISSAAADANLFTIQSKTANGRLSPEDKEAVGKIRAEGYSNTNEGRTELFSILWKPYVFDQQKVSSIKNATSDNTFLLLRYVQQSTKDYAPYENLYKNLPSLRIPTLIVHGNYDPVPLEAAQKNHQAIKDSKLVVLENCGHFPFIEQPEIFTSTVMDFLKSIEK